MIFCVRQFKHTEIKLLMHFKLFSRLFIWMCRDYYVYYEESFVCMLGTKAY